MYNSTNTYGYTVTPKHENLAKGRVDPVDPVDRRPKDPPGKTTGNWMRSTTRDP